MSEHFVRDRGILQGDAYHLSASQFPAFANRIGDFAGLAKADSHPTTLIPDNDQRTEIKAPATFDDFGGAINEDDFLGQFLFLTFQVSVGSLGCWPAAARAKAATPATLLARLFTNLGLGLGLVAVLWLCWFSHNILLH